MQVLATAWRLLRGLLLGVAALVIFIEEWGWRPLVALVGRLARWPPLARLEARIGRSGPRVALLLFLAPTLLLLPVKLGALWFIDQGRPGLGLALILAAKLIGTALLGRLFVLLERQLRTFSWFVRILDWWQETKARVAEVVRRSAPWQAVQALLRATRTWLRRKLGR